MAKKTRYIERDVDHRTNVREDLNSDIADYYDQSYWDYRTSWLNSHLTQQFIMGIGLITRNPIAIL